MLRALSEALAPGGALASKALSEKGVLQLLLDLRFLHDLLSGGGAPPSGTRWVLQQQQLMGAGPWGVGCVRRWQVRGNGGGKTIFATGATAVQSGWLLRATRRARHAVLRGGQLALQWPIYTSVWVCMLLQHTTRPPRCPHVAALRRARWRRPAWWLPAGASWRG